MNCMFLLILISTFLGFDQASAQYEDYSSYQSFTDLDEAQTDYGLYFSPSLMYLAVDEDNEINNFNATDRSRGVLAYDLKLGYIFRDGFSFGILFSADNVTVNGGNPENDRESVGLNFGYMTGGFAISATYFLTSTQNLTGAGDVSQYSEGTGYQVDVGYFYRLNSFFSLGPQIVYKSFTYTEGESATTRLKADASSTHTFFTPMFAMFFNLYRGS